jgi:ParB family chromosome partitioning protein
VGHAKILLGIDNSALRIQLLGKILTGDLNIRQTERQANIYKSERPATMPSTPRELSESLMKIEKQIAQQLAANVSLQHSSAHGKIIIEYRGEQELLRIIQSMGIE